MRKSVSYLNSLRHEVTSALAEMDHTATTMADATSDLMDLPPDNLRNPDHDETIKVLYRLQADYRKQLKILNTALSKYRSFF